MNPIIVFQILHTRCTVQSVVRINKQINTNLYISTLCQVEAYYIKKVSHLAHLHFYGYLFLNLNRL